jgi:hypothetical protein
MPRGALTRRRSRSSATPTAKVQGGAGACRRCARSRDWDDRQTLGCGSFSATAATSPPRSRRWGTGAIVCGLPMTCRPANGLLIRRRAPPRLAGSWSRTPGREHPARGRCRQSGDYRAIGFSIYKARPELIHQTYFVSREWAAEHVDVLERFVAGLRRCGTPPSTSRRRARRSASSSNCHRADRRSRSDQPTPRL